MEEGVRWLVNGEQVEMGQAVEIKVWDRAQRKAGVEAGEAVGERESYWENEETKTERHGDGHWLGSDGWVGGRMQRVRMVPRAVVGICGGMVEYRSNGRE